MVEVTASHLAAAALRGACSDIPQSQLAWAEEVGLWSEAFAAAVLPAPTVVVGCVPLCLFAGSGYGDGYGDYGDGYGDGDGSGYGCGT